MHKHCLFYDDKITMGLAVPSSLLPVTTMVGNQGFLTLGVTWSPLLTYKQMKALGYKTMLNTQALVVCNVPKGAKEVTV